MGMPLSRNTCITAREQGAAAVVIALTLEKSVSANLGWAMRNCSIASTAPKFSTRPSWISSRTRPGLNSRMSTPVTPAWISGVMVFQPPIWKNGKVISTLRNGPTIPVARMSNEFQTICRWETTQIFGTAVVPPVCT